MTYDGKSELDSGEGAQHTAPTFKDWGPPKSPQLFPPPPQTGSRKTAPCGCRFTMYCKKVGCVGGAIELAGIAGVVGGGGVVGLAGIAGVVAVAGV